MARTTTASTGRPSRHVSRRGSGDRSQAHRDMWVVRRYLNHLHGQGSARRRSADPERVRARLEKVEAALAERPAPVERLLLIQERLDLQAQLERGDGDRADAVELEAAFVEAAARYSQRRGISWAAWREVGVPAAVLRAAGITRD